MPWRSLGALLATPLFAVAGVISSGSVTIPGTWSFDFDAGVVDTLSDPEADVFWEQFTSTTRALEPANGALIVNIGVVSFADETLADLEALSYGAAGIDGSDTTSVLVSGDVFALETNAGNFAKVLVTGPLAPGSDNGLQIQWETDSPAVPEPGGPVLCLAGIAGLALLRRILRVS